MTAAQHPRKTNKVGAFFVPHMLIDQFPAAVSALQRDVLIVHAMSDFARDGIGYVGFSDHFDPVPAGAIVPGYSITISAEKDEETGAEVIKELVFNRSID